MSGAADAWSFVPGPWLALLGTRTAVVVPVGVRDRIGELWPLVDDGASFTELLDALIAPGLSKLPDFVLAEMATGASKTHAVVRGKQLSARLETDEGPVEIDGSQANTWAEYSGTGVKAIHITSEDGAEVSTGETAEDQTAPRVFTLPAGVVTVGHLSHGAPTHRETPDGEQGEQGEVVTVTEPGEATEMFDSMTMSTGVAPAYDDVSAPGPGPGPGPGPEFDPDGATQFGSVAEEPSNLSPGIPGQPPAPERTRPVALLKVSNGENVEVDRVVLFGRAPQVKRFSGSEQPRLITVPSPLHEISATHVEVRPGSGVDHGSAVVTDLGSTNGTVLIQPGLDHEELKPGIAVQLLPGAVINLGDGVTITVSRPGS